MSINTLPYNNHVLQSPTVGGYSVLNTQVKSYSIGSFFSFQNVFTVNGLVANKPVLVQAVFQIPDGVLSDCSCNFQLNVNGSTVSNQTIHAYTGVKNLYLSFSATFTPPTEVNQIQPYLECPGTYFSSISNPAYQSISVFQ